MKSAADVVAQERDLLAVLDPDLGRHRDHHGSDYGCGFGSRQRCCSGGSSSFWRSNFGQPPNLQLSSVPSLPKE